MTALWQSKRVGDILQLEYGKPLDQVHRKAGGLYPVYGANGEKDRSDTFYVGRPSIIVGRKGSAGELNLTEDKFWPLDVTYFVTFDERHNDLRFLYYLLRTLDLRRMARGIKPGINRNEVYSQVVRTTALPEQQRIVGILDEAFAAIATVRTNTEQNLRNAREVSGCYLNEVFAGRGNGWVDRRLGDVCAFVRGPFGGSLKKEMFVADGYAVYEQSHAISNQFADIRYFIDARKFSEMRRFEVRPNDIVMSCSGTMGRTAIVPEGVRRGIINQALLKLTPSSHVLADFLKSWMESEDFQDALKAYAAGAAIQNVASVKVLKDIRVPVPSLAEQRRVVVLLGEASLETDRLASIYQRKLAALDALKQSLLHQAFTGSL
jgi:type I restriction enzyme S subunit